jgi:hypothetical protein
MGSNRSLRKLEQNTNKTLTHLGTLSSRHDWQARVQAFDEYVFKLDEEAAVQRIRDFNKKRAEQAIAMMDQGFDEMVDEYLQSAKDKNDRFKLGFDVFMTIHKLNKERIEHSGSVVVNVEERAQRIHNKILEVCGDDV